ncbi:RraA family protein [uncultured Jatrophihabitans sp.]|uniref:RraA family protein n=1 Tax=uncultured Jatrophihabitans sp. TaxID=1610747 RepID=UPI0035CC0F0E
MAQGRWPAGVSAAESDWRRLLEFGAATVYEAQGCRGAVDEAIKPIDPGMQIVGPAYPVDAGYADNRMLHLALTRVPPGHVLVVDARGCVHAGPWGDVLTRAAQQARVVGLVIDGAVRDAQRIVDLGFPVFARGLSIRATSKQHRGETGGRVVIGGCAVSMGDVVVGDRDGVVIVTADDVENVLVAAAGREAHEQNIVAQVQAGTTTADLLNLSSDDA